MWLSLAVEVPSPWHGSHRQGEEIQAGGVDVPNVSMVLSLDKAGM